MANIMKGAACTKSAKPAELEEHWVVIDAAGQTLGRLATQVAMRLRGKHRGIYTPHIDTGDYVIIINAAKVHVTGRKLEQKVYHWHTGYIGNLKSRSLKDMLSTHPDRVIRHAVGGMIPRNPLGRAMMRKLKIYGGAEHPHQAQTTPGGCVAGARGLKV